MKRSLSVSLASILIGAAIVVGPPANATVCVGFAGGDGSVENPYQVSSRAELEALDTCYASGNYFLQTADIDLGGENDPWTPLGGANAFAGNYDGGNYEIQNLHVVRQWNAGLFDGTAGAVFTRVRLIDFSVTSLSGGYAGGLVAFSRDTVVSKTIIKGTVTSTGITGGLIGVHWGGQMKHVSEIYADVNVSGGGNGTGGLIGQSIAEASVIEDVFVKGTISGSSLGGGGVVGFGEYSQLRRAVSIALVNGTNSYRGGVAGYFGGNTAVFTDSFHLDTAVTTISSNYPTSRTMAQLTSAGTYTNFDLGTIVDSPTKWRIIDGLNDGLPFLSFTTIVNSPPATPEPVAYSGPIVKVSYQKVAAGDVVAFSGERLLGITAVSIGGQVAEIKTQSEEGFSIRIPSGLSAGTYDLVITSDSGILTVQDGLKVSPSATVASLARSSTRLKQDGSVKVYVNDVVGAGKVQVFHNGKEVGWVRATDASNSRLRDGYFVRTINLQPGKNIITVFREGVQVSRKAYTK